MPRTYNDKTLARVCVRVWADDYEYLRRVSKVQGALGLNLTIRQIIHSYVSHLKDEEQRQLNKLPDDTDLLDIQIDLSNLEFEVGSPPEPEPEGEVINIPF